MANPFLSENQPSLNQVDTRTRFTGDAVIVTGGASGIGRATVERFLNDGASVAIFDINEVAGREVLKWGERKDYDLVFHKVDVSRKEECEEGVTTVVKKYGDRLKYLVNSVANFVSKGLDSTSSDWEKTLSVNVVGYVNMVQACVPYMKNTKGSAIVNLSSISGKRAQPNRWTYAASKGAIDILTKTMALDLSPYGIRVNSVTPSWIWTPEEAKVSNGDRDKMEAMVSKFHMSRRHGETSEVAAAVTFLCSKDASFITATDLPVDGGYLAMSAEGLGAKSVFAGCAQ